jgi:hypothetical protein
MKETDKNTHDGKLHIGRAKLGSVLVDILYPLVMLLESICGYSNNLYIPFREIIRATSDLPELGCADRGKVARMREENGLGRIMK